MILAKQTKTSEFSRRPPVTTFYLVLASESQHWMALSGDIRVRSSCTADYTCTWKASSNTEWLWVICVPLYQSEHSATQDLSPGINERRQNSLSHGAFNISIVYLMCRPSIPP